jgi:hypothetical protein
MCAPEGGGDGDVDGDSDADVESEGEPCPSDMVLAGEVCIDRYEAARGPGDTALSAAGGTPWVYVTWSEAQRACEAASKTLCDSVAWVLACGGPEGQTYPYGSSFEAGRCVDAYVDSGRDPEPTGSMPRCEGYYPGLFDMSGNVSEWSGSCADGHCDVMIGAHADGEERQTCGGYTPVPPSEYFGDLGFRCCRQPRAVEWDLARHCEHICQLGVECGRIGAHERGPCQEECLALEFTEELLACFRAATTCEELQRCDCGCDVDTTTCSDGCECDRDCFAGFGEPCTRHGDCWNEGYFPEVPRCVALRCSRSCNFFPSCPSGTGCEEIDFANSECTWL